MFDERILFMYMGDLVRILPEKIAKDISLEIDHDRNFPNRESYIEINMYYKNELVYSPSYDMDDILITGKSFKFEEDVNQFKKNLMNQIFQKFCNDIPEEDQHG